MAQEHPDNASRARTASIRIAESTGRWVFDLVAIAVLTALYFYAGKLGLALAYIHPSATPVWPPTGISLAALLLLGYRVWPGIALGAFCINSVTAGNTATSLAIACGNTLEALAGAWLVNRFARGCDAFDRPRHVAHYVIGASFLSTLISPSIGVTSLAVSGFVDWNVYSRVWLTWWLGDMSSAITLTPFFLIWSTKRLPKLSSRRIVEAIGLSVLTVVTGQIVFTGWSPWSAQHYPITFFCLPVLVWATLRFGQHGAATASLLLSGIAIWGTVHGFGPFAMTEPAEALLLLQTLMVVISLTMLVLASLVVERQRAMQTLREHREHLDIALDAGQMGTWEWDIRTGKVTWSTHLEKLYGLAPGTFGGTFDDFKRDTHPEDEARVLETLRRALRESSRYHIEYRIVRPDGSHTWLEARGHIVRDTKGLPLRMIGVCADITERMRAEEAMREVQEHLAHLTENLKNSLHEKEVLLKEIHHRVKNNMQVISSLLSLQSDYVKDPNALALFKESQNRIRSMALVHEQLYQSSDLAHIDFGEYLERLTTQLRRTYAVSSAVRVVVEAEPTLMTIDKAIPCGLIVNELIANALEHAFPEGRAGQVDVTLRQEPDHRVRLTIADNGVGLLSGFNIEEAKTFGLQLVNALKDQIDAELSLTREGGTMFELKFHPFARGGVERLPASISHQSV